MTHKQFKQANSIILSIFTAMLLIILLFMAVGCTTQRQVVYKTISFSDTNGVTTIYYPLSMEKDMVHPHEDVRWKYVASKNASDDGKAKVMTVKP